MTDPSPSDALAHRSFHQQLRILTGVALAAWGIFTVQYSVMGRFESSMVVGVVSVAMGLLFALSIAERQIGVMRLVAHGFLAVNLLGLLAGAEVSGQTASMSLWFLCVVPLFAGYQLGWRAAVAWSIVVVITLALQLVISPMVPIAPDFVAAGWELTAGQIVLTSIVLAFALATRTVHDRHLHALREREAEIARQADAVRISRDEAVRAERIKAEFLANMSHEIRTPLNGVLGFTRVLMQRPLDDADRALVERISRSGTLLLSIVNDILDFSKIESGHLELAPGPVEIRHLVQSVTDMFAVVATEKNLIFEAKVDPAVPAVVEVDETRLHQVFCNLVGNAVKFTESGGVKFHMQAATPGRIHVTVTDSGIGIAAEQIDRLFKKFSQIDGTSTRQFGGTGLGLAISLQLIERMGGRIWVESEAGVGSRFHCEFDAPEIAWSRSFEKPAAPTPLPPLRILVAEDNLVNQEVLGHFLEILGQRATMVDNGRKAVEAVEREKFDVILLDMQMPEMDGIEATRRIREYTRDFEQRPRLISLSANVMAEHRQKMLAAGVDDILGKPVQLERLAHVLAQSTPAPHEAPADALASVRNMLIHTPQRYILLLERHIANMSAIYTALRAAAEAGERESMLRAAHSLKGSSAQFGATAVWTMCETIESLAGFPDTAALDELQRAVDRAAAACREEIARVPRP